MIVSWIGNPAPLLSCSSVPPVSRVITTLNEEIDDTEGRVAEKAKNYSDH